MTEVRTRGGASTRSGWARAARSRLGPAGAAVTAAGVMVNLVGYIVPVLGARKLSAADLGALASVLAIGAIATVPALGLQTALAVKTAQFRRVAQTVKVTAATAGVTAAVLVIGAPLIAAALRLSVMLPLLVAATTVAVVNASRWLGQLQGAQRFYRLAAGMVLLAVARYGGVIAGLVAGMGVTGSLAVGAAVSWLVLPVIGVLARWRGRTPDRAVPPHRIGHEQGSGGQHAAPGRLAGRDVVAASGATLAMLVVSYADLIVARHLLPADEAGAYAVGSVLTKGALWAPQVVTILALPRLAQGSRRAMLAALAVVASCGAALVIAAAAAGDLAVRMAGGAAYAGLAGYADGFALIGALYAIVFVFVNAEIAAGVRWPAAPLWVAVVGLGVAASLLGTPTLGSVLAISLCTAGATTLIMAALAIWRAKTAAKESVTAGS